MVLISSRTGIIYNVTKSAVGIIVNKKVGNRFLEKRVNIRIEHIKHSKCRDDFLRRVKENAAAKLKAKADGVKVNLKRLPAQPRLSRHVSSKYNTPVTLNPIPYDSKCCVFHGYLSLRPAYVPLVPSNALVILCTLLIALL